MGSFFFYARIEDLGLSDWIKHFIRKLIFSSVFISRILPIHLDGVAMAPLVSTTFHATPYGQRQKLDTKKALV